MKKPAILLLIMLFSFAASATVRTVSNNPDNLGQFNTIQAAIDASADSDTVYVYGSPNVYAAFTIQDKKITVIGPGWAPDKNLPHTVVVNGASIRDSPAGGSPNGSELHGLIFNNTVTLSRNAVGGDMPTNNIRIIRCSFSGALNFDLGATGILLEGSIFYWQLNFNASATYTNCLFQNNMFFFPNGALSSQINGLFNAINIRFDHNLFYSNNNGGGSNIFVFSNSRFLSFSNNIFNQANVSSGVSFSTFNNNITNNVTLNNANATGNATPWDVNSNVNSGGNVANTSPGMADQTAANSGNGSGLLNFTIATGSANNSGSDGKDMGLLYDTTGSLNWTNSRNSRIPRIFSMDITTPTVTPGGNLNVNVNARKSN